TAREPRLKRPHPKDPDGAACPWTFLVLIRSGRDAGGFFHDGKAHAGLVAVLFRDRAPGILGFLAGLERTLHLSRAFHERVEVHRTELAANHPEIAAFCHGSLPLFGLMSLSCLD